MESDDDKYLKLAEDPEQNAEVLEAMVRAAANSRGYTVEAWHGTRKGWGFSDFEVGKGGDHFGSLAQAEARGGRGNARKFFLKMEHTARIKDKGSLSKFPEGSDSVVYLNRFEGVSLESARKYSGEQFDAMTDREFRTAVPEAEMSFAVKSAAQIKSAAIIELDSSGKVIPLTRRFSISTDFRGVTDEPASLSKSGSHSKKRESGSLTYER